MEAIQPFLGNDDGNSHDETLFARIAEDIEQKGYSIQPAALPEPIAAALLEQHQQFLKEEGFKEAGVGRGVDYVKTEFIRQDEIRWITGDTPAGQQWITWTTQLRTYLNRRLFLGLFSFESHFAHYPPGAFYKRHYDAFRGEANRVLSVVAYLNPGWGHEDGGELVLYRSDEDCEGIKVVPLYGTLVVFLSEEFPHEVLPAKRDRHSVAGWYRVNTTLGNKVDPPL